MTWLKGRSGFIAKSGVREVGKSESYKDVKSIVGSLRDCHLEGWHLERSRRATLSQTKVGKWAVGKGRLCQML